VGVPTHRIGSADSPRFPASGTGSSGLPRPRLTPPSPDQFTPEQEGLYGKLSTGPFAHKAIDRDGSLLGLAVLTIIRPDLSRPLMELGEALLTEQFFSARTREIVILVTARSWQCEFVWHAHTEMAREAGVTNAEIAALHAGTLTLADPVDDAAYRMACAMLDHDDLDDEKFHAASAVLTPEQLIEVAMLVGNYTHVALDLRVFRIGLPSGVQPYFLDATESAT
jgi:4-carboxymuconolactone decarboxylase